jgi:hypothetical protein
VIRTKQAKQAKEIKEKQKKDEDLRKHEFDQKEWLHEWELKRLLNVYKSNTGCAEKDIRSELKWKAEERERAIKGKDAAQNAVDKYKEETMTKWMKKDKETEASVGDEAELLEMEDGEAEEVEI